MTVFQHVWQRSAYHPRIDARPAPRMNPKERRIRELVARSTYTEAFTSRMDPLSAYGRKAIARATRRAARHLAKAPRPTILVLSSKAQARAAKRAAEAQNG